MKGDSYSSRRLFSLLFAGTIPVIICDYCMLPYQDMIDYSKFAIFLPESEVLDNPEYDIFDVLDSIPQKELDRLRRNGRIVKKHFIFHEGKPQPGDAFDMMVSIQPLFGQLPIVLSLTSHLTIRSASLP